MFVFNGRWTRIGVIALLTMISTALMTGQSKSQPQRSMHGALSAQTPAERVKDLLFETIVTTCPVGGSSSPAMFFYDENGAWGREPRVVVRRTLFEYRGAWNKLYQYPLREADKLNGIQFKGLAVLGAPAVRAFEYYDDLPALQQKWSSWESRSNLRPASEIIYNGNIEGSSAVVLAVTMLKRNNEWSFRVGWGEPDARHSFDPDTVASQQKPCSVAINSTPLSASDHR